MPFLKRFKVPASTSFVFEPLCVLQSLSYFTRFCGEKILYYLLPSYVLQEYERGKDTKLTKFPRRPMSSKREVELVGKGKDGEP